MSDYNIYGKSIALTAGVLVMAFLITVIALAWTEPTEGPPGSNVAAPINVSDDPQNKLGDLGIGGGTGQAVYWLNNAGGTLKLINESLQEQFSIGQDGAATFEGGLDVNSAASFNSDILDSSGNYRIYDSSSNKIERERLPFEQGDITSDVDTNTWDSGYYDVSNLIPGNVKQGVNFGRNQTGTLPTGTTGYTEGQSWGQNLEGETIVKSGWCKIGEKGCKKCSACIRGQGWYCPSGFNSFKTCIEGEHWASSPGLWSYTICYTSDNCTRPPHSDRIFTRPKYTEYK